MIRTMLSEAMWGRLAPLLPPQKPWTGRPSLDHRQLPGGRALAGPHRRTVARPAACADGLAQRLAPPPALDGDRHLGADRRCAAGAGARRAAGAQAPGRSRGGFSTRLHLRCDGHGRPVTFHLTGGERHDLIGVGPLFERGALRTGRRGRPRWKPAAIIADKAYPAAWLLDTLRHKGILPVIPNRPDQPENPDLDRAVYRERNLMERLVGKLKQLRRLATRYDKLDPHHLAFVQIASVILWLRSFGDTG